MWTLRRPAARVVLLDREQRIFLINGRDPADPTKPPWLEIPGGGIDPGEDSERAVARELHEETGIEDAEIGPVVWKQYVEFDFGSGADWWSLEDLLASDTPVLPVRLREFLPDLVAGNLPDAPIDIAPLDGPKKPA